MKTNTLVVIAAVSLLGVTSVFANQQCVCYGKKPHRQCYLIRHHDGQCVCYGKKPHRQCYLIKSDDQCVDENIETILGISVENRDYIDNLAVPGEGKELLYAVATTPKGQANLDTVSSASSVGTTAASITVPIAYALDWRHFAIGASYVNHWPNSNKEDGSISAAIGFGNALDYVGFTASVFVGSVNPSDTEVAEDGSFSFQVYHVFPHNWALGIGVANAFPWGAYKSVSHDYYAVVTKIFDFEVRDYHMPFVATVGLGTGAFDSLKRNNSKDDNNVRPYFAAGWNVIPQVSLIGEYVTDMLNLGIGIKPIKTIPVMINLSQNNVNKSGGHNSKSYFMAAATLEVAF